jgi:hypothetical protein
MNTNRSPQCDCDAWGFLCDQGRRCPHRGAAEAATDIGAEDRPLTPRQTLPARLAVAVALATLALSIGLAIAEWVAP